MTQSTIAQDHDSAQRIVPGAARLDIRSFRIRIAGAVLLGRPFVQQGSQQIPDREIDNRAHDEKVRLEIQRAGNDPRDRRPANRAASRDKAATCRTARGRKGRPSPVSSACRLPESGGWEGPTGRRSGDAAEDGHAAQREHHPEDERQQVGMEELRPILSGQTPAPRSGSGRRRRTASARLCARSICSRTLSGSVFGKVIAIAPWIAPTAAAADCCVSFSRSDSGTSSILALRAELQHANVGRDAPAIGGLDARRIAVHGAKTIGHHFIEMPGGRVAQALNVIGRRLRKSALHDHAPARAGVVVAGRAIDVVALAAALEIGPA